MPAARAARKMSSIPAAPASSRWVPVWTATFPEVAFPQGLLPSGSVARLAQAPKSTAATGPHSRRFIRSWRRLRCSWPPVEPAGGVARTPPAASPGAWELAVGADLDGDGDPDLLPLQVQGDRVVGDVGKDEGHALAEGDGLGGDGELGHVQGLVVLVHAGVEGGVLVDED